MFQWIRSLLGNKKDQQLPEPLDEHLDEKPSEERDSNYDATKSEVDKVLNLDLSSVEAREEHGDFVMTVIHKLDVEIENISQQSGNYPSNPISALVWMDGTTYTALTSALTTHFREAGWLDREENASMLWAKVVLSVCSHYHHMVGPAMLANADCHERLGNSQRAVQMYSGLVQDFAFIADDWAGKTDSPTDEDRLALESLHTAAKRLIANDVNELEGADIVAIQIQTESILSRPDSA